MVALLAEVRKAARREAAAEAAAQFATWENSQEQPAPLEIVVKHSDRDPVRLDGPFHPMLPTVITMLGAKSHVYLVGPAGCGKTTIAEQAAKALGIEFRFTGAVGSPYELVGYRDANGHVIRTQFRDAYEHGGLFLFDEVDASDARALLRFNAALANGWSDFPDGKIARHPDFRCIAAANTFGNGADRQYVGRAQLDAATLDRFAFLPMDYDETLEKSIGDAAWCQYIHKVRRIVRDLKLRHVVSTRAVIMGSALLGAGVERATVEAAVLWKGLDADGIAKVRTAL